VPVPAGAKRRGARRAVAQLTPAANRIEGPGFACRWRSTLWLVQGPPGGAVLQSPAQPGLYNRHAWWPSPAISPLRDGGRVQDQMLRRRMADWGEAEVRGRCGCGRRYRILHAKPDQVVTCPNC